MATFSDYADEIALVLDDDPTAPPARILAFEESIQPHATNDLDNALVYRDFLKERGCPKRIMDLNARLAETLRITEKALEEVADAEVRTWLLGRQQSLRNALEGVEVDLSKWPGPLRGVGIIRFPSHGLTPEENRYARDQAREMAANIHAGTVLCLPSARDQDGNYLWDFRIEGGDPGQVKIERNGGGE